MRNISEKSGRENQNTDSKFNKGYNIYEIMWKNKVEADRPRVTI
jgi:hypothetical protein